MSETPQPPYPLDPEIEKLLDSQYVEFYNKYIINQQPVHYQPLEASRSSGTLIPGGGEMRTVAKIEDIDIERKFTKGDNVRLRIFTPDCSAPAGGYPILIYLHGGGWVLGNINTENVHCSNWCSIAKCVVVNVDYRLAPEYPYPACVEDTWETYMWLVKTGAGKLNGSITNIAAAGSSAGGNLAAILSHMIIEAKVSQPELPLLKFTVLVVPVTDNAADGKKYLSWEQYKNTAALPAAKMMWFRNHYLPDSSAWKDVRASPIYYSDSSFAKAPPAYIAVAELDVLRGEGEAYHEKLLKNGVKSTLKVYKGMPHPVMAMDGVLDKGAELVADCAQAMHNFFYDF